MNPGPDYGEYGRSSTRQEALCAAPEALCPSRHAPPLASPRSGFSFFFSIFFRLTPFSSFFLSWHFHAVAAFCMRRVPSADIVVVVF